MVEIQAFAFFSDFRHHALNELVFLKIIVHMAASLVPGKALSDLNDVQDYTEEETSHLLGVTKF